MSLSPATCSGEIRAAISVFLAIVIALATVAGIKPPAPKLLARSPEMEVEGRVLCLASPRIGGAPFRDSQGIEFSAPGSQWRRCEE